MSTATGTASCVGAEQPYPEPLRRAVVARNHPILRHTRSSLAQQIDSALARADAPAVLDRTAALLVSYVDVLFAANRVPHPGQKRLVAWVERTCARAPADLGERLEVVRPAPGAPRPAAAGRHPLPTVLHGLIDDLDEILADDGLSPERVDPHAPAHGASGSSTRTWPAPSGAPTLAPTARSRQGGDVVARGLGEQQRRARARRLRQQEPQHLAADPATPSLAGQPQTGLQRVRCLHPCQPGHAHRPPVHQHREGQLAVPAVQPGEALAVEGPERRRRCGVQPGGPGTAGWSPPAPRPRRPPGAPAPGSPHPAAAG